MSNIQTEEDAIELFAEFYYSTNYIALVNVARVTALISIIGSSAIVYDICKKKAWKSTANRLIFCMSLCDIVFSLIASVLGTIMMPKGSSWGSFGSWETCKAQGFLTLVFLQPACFLNVNLSIYYVICLRLGWREDKFRRPLVQLWLFGLPFLLGLTSGIWGLVDGAYTLTLWSCNLAPSPLGCQEMPEVVGECTRGLNANLIEQVWTYILMIFTVVIIASVGILYWSVLKTERSNDQYAVDGQVNRNLSNRVAMQGVYYSFCFLLTYMFYYVWFFGYDLRGAVAPYWLIVMLAISIPLQGFFNAIVYFRRSKPTDAEVAQGVWGRIKTSLRRASTTTFSRVRSMRMSKTSSNIESTALFSSAKMEVSASSPPASGHFLTSAEREEPSRPVEDTA